jgi:hypothetical protein
MRLARKEERNLSLAKGQKMRWGQASQASPHNFMTRKETEKDSDRPHYYSQFWLDIAAGRRTIGGPKPEDGEGIEPEIEVAPAPRRTVGRTAPSDISETHITDGYTDNIVHPVAEPITTPDAFIEPEVDDFTESDDLDIQSPVEDADIPDMDLGVLDEDEDEEPFDDEEEGEEDEEEEDDIGWGGGRGRKKAKPVRPTKVVPKKPGRREPRRGY